MKAAGVTSLGVTGSACFRDVTHDRPPNVPIATMTTRPPNVPIATMTTRPPRAALVCFQRDTIMSMAGTRASDQ